MKYNTNLNISTTVAPIYQLGLIPSFVDVEMNKFIVDIKKIEKILIKNKSNNDPKFTW